jgi:ApbE superfamily uncharacterized protein (UPF0280 family)
VSGPQRAPLPDGKRQHFQHGPIDLVIEAFGPAAEVAAATEQAWARFETILEELVAELPALRSPLPGPAVRGPTARRMVAACAPHAVTFVTPMAAVAGAVADEVLAALVAGRSLERAYVNDGGDIALHLTARHSFDTGLVTLAERPTAEGLARIDWTSPVRGIASSGWRGRSLSLGIADSVTVLARSAAAADAAATLIANAVDVDDPAVRREPARALDPDSDLGERPVTVEVGALPRPKVELALARGVAAAGAMRARGLIEDAMLVLQSEIRVVGQGLRSVA